MPFKIISALAAILIFSLIFINQKSTSHQAEQFLIKKNVFDLANSIEQIFLVIQKNKTPSSTHIFKAKSSLERAKSMSTVLTSTFKEKKYSDLSTRLSTTHERLIAIKALLLAIENEHQQLQQQRNITGNLEVQLKPIEENIWRIQSSQLSSTLTQESAQYLSKLSTALARTVAAQQMYTQLSMLSPQAATVAHSQLSDSISKFLLLTEFSQKGSSQSVYDPRHRAQIRQISQKTRKIMRVNSNFFAQPHDPNKIIELIHTLHEDAPLHTQALGLEQLLREHNPLWLSQQFQLILLILALGTVGVFGYQINTRKNSLEIRKPKKPQLQTSTLDEDRMRKKILMAQIKEREGSINSPKLDSTILEQHCAETKNTATQLILPTELDQELYSEKEAVRTFHQVKKSSDNSKGSNVRNNALETLINQDDQTRVMELTQEDTLDFGEKK